jgi:hypothetical protein
MKRKMKQTKNKANKKKNKQKSSKQRIEQTKNKTNKKQRVVQAARLSEKCRDTSSTNPRYLN